ncbi:hypothetical protein MMC26_005441 [Xylographa opegraphella]|nr:hypothetical protein [Xylographa opegraphella]
MVEEFHEPEDALESDSSDSSDIDTSDNEFSFVLSSRAKSNTRSRHPPPERIHQLWQIFIENVDPMTKIVHVPTLRPAIQKAASNIATIPRSFEALLFSIYCAAVMTLHKDECEQRLGEPRKTLLSRYISATKAALLRAKFMGTISLVVLQALVLFIISVRDIYEPRTVWSLTGVAVRIAQSMGLERDGAKLNLPPFETEMRRRLWWLLKTHDFRAAELCGLVKLRDLNVDDESTKYPTNLNDDQLYPGMPSFVAESNTLTDSVFVAVRYEILNFAARRVAKFRQEGKTPSQWNLNVSGSDKADMDEAFRDVEEVIETKYLRYCDPSQPLQLLTMVVARFAMNVIRFLSHHPRRWSSIEQTPLSEREWVWQVSIKLLEQHNMLQSSPQLKRFTWHAAYFQQWHAFIHVLDTLRAKPLIADAEKAWQLIGDKYKNTPDMVLDTKKPIHVAVGNLCLKAYNDREAELERANICAPATPAFIAQLRQQREMAKAKRQAREAKSSRPEIPVSHDLTGDQGVGFRPHGGTLHASDTLDSVDLQQSTTSHGGNVTQTDVTIEGDPYWLITGLDDSHVDNLNNAMDMDLGFILAQDPMVDDNDTQTITWEQWDTWLANSNLMPMLSSAQG